MTTAYPDHAPVRFEPCGFNRELIKLGVVTIGEIHGQEGRRPKASLLFRLPDAPRTMFTFESMSKARTKAADLTREWMEAAGVRV